MCPGATGEHVEAVLAWCPARQRTPGRAYCPVPRTVWGVGIGIFVRIAIVYRRIVIIYRRIVIVYCRIVID